MEARTQVNEVRTQVNEVRTQVNGDQDTDEWRLGHR